MYVFMKTAVPDAMTRTTFSLTVRQLQSLEKIAILKKVSVSWVIRSAIDDYLEGVADSSVSGLIKSVGKDEK